MIAMLTRTVRATSDRDTHEIVMPSRDTWIVGGVRDAIMFAPVSCPPQYSLCARVLRTHLAATCRRWNCACHAGGWDWSYLCSERSCAGLFATLRPTMTEDMTSVTRSARRARECYSVDHACHCLARARYLFDDNGDCAGTLRMEVRSILARGLRCDAIARAETLQACVLCERGVSRAVGETPR